MLDIKKIMKTEKGIFLFSIILGLGIAGLFKMSCDSRSCIVYTAPDLTGKKQIKVNNKCYRISEEMIDCEKVEESSKIFM